MRIAMTSQLIVCLVFAAYVTVLIEAPQAHAKTTNGPALRRYALVI
jgi:hypothetical protein